MKSKWIGISIRSSNWILSRKEYANWTVVRPCQQISNIFNCLILYCLINEIVWAVRGTWVTRNKSAFTRSSILYFALSNIRLWENEVWLSRLLRSNSYQRSHIVTEAVRHLFYVTRDIVVVEGTQNLARALFIIFATLHSRFSTKVCI